MAGKASQSWWKAKGWSYMAEARENMCRGSPLYKTIRSRETYSLLWKQHSKNPTSIFQLPPTGSLPCMEIITIQSEIWVWMQNYTISITNLHFSCVYSQSNTSSSGIWIILVITVGNSFPMNRPSLYLCTTQSVLNAPARGNLLKLNSNLATSLFKTLLWHPISFRAKAKCVTIAYRVLNDVAPCFFLYWILERFQKIYVHLELQELTLFGSSLCIYN